MTSPALPALDIGALESIGKVVSVDTSRVWIDANDPQAVARVRVGNLVCIGTTKTTEFLIGSIERVTRSIRHELLTEEEDDDGGIPTGEVPDDMLRVVLVGTYRTVDGERSNVFKRGADSFPPVDKPCYLIEGDNLQRFMGLLSSEIDTSERLELGHYVADGSALAIASGDRLFQRHAAILGSTGSGKSWAVASLLERAQKLAHPNIIVLDMHGEYTPLTVASGTEHAYAAGFHIAGPGDLDTPPESALFLPFWLLNREEMLSMFLDRSDQNAPNQASRFTAHVRDLKEKTLDAQGKHEVKKTFTVDSPIPYALDELVKRLQDDNTRKGIGSTGKPVKGEWEGRLTRFLSRLTAKTSDRRYGFLFQPPESALGYGWLANQVWQLLRSDDDGPGIKIVDFSEVPSDVLPVVAGTFARLLYDIQFWMDPDHRTPFCLLCDEAHLYLPAKSDANAVQRRALASFERIAKEGRKYGVSIVAVSQRPSDVSRTILSQCNNFITLRQTNDKDQNVIRSLVPDSLGGLIDILPMLDIGEALVLGDAVLLPSRIKLSAPTVKPSSATRDFWQEWNTSAPTQAAIEKATEALRKQTRE